MRLSVRQAPATESTPPGGSHSNRLRGRTLVAARAIWLALTLLAAGFFIASIPALYHFASTPCAAKTCGNGQVGPAAIRALHGLGLSLGWFAGFAVALQVGFAAVYGAVGALIFWRRSDDRMALLVSIALIMFGAETFGGSMEVLAALHPGLRFPVAFIGYLGSVAFTLFLYCFPDGRFVPRWTRWVALAWAAQQVPIQFFPRSVFDTRTWPVALQLTMWVGVLASVVYAQVYRYRHVSTRLEREQTKWVVLGIAVGLGGFIAGTVLTVAFAAQGAAVSPQSLGAQLAGTAIVYMAMLAIPITIGIAMLRYRLFEVDVLISRAFIYGALTACVVGLYVLIVGTFSVLLQGRGNLIVSLLATGVVAVLFEPLRSRLQRGVNRLVYGQRDEPYAVLSRLGRRLEAALAPEAALATLVETVAQALKLPHASIALREGDIYVTAASYGTPAGEPLVLELAYQGEMVGQLTLSPRTPGEGWSEADKRLLDDLAHQAGVAAHAALLTADLQRSRERIVVAREETRRRLRRDLHDGLAPTLAALALKAGTVGDLIASNPDEATTQIRELEGEMRAAIRDIRRLAYELRPPTLDELGLVAAVREAAVRQSAASSGTDIVVEAPERFPPLPAAAEVAAYRIAQEALTNVTKHAQAQWCVVRLTLGEALTVEVVDDGIGLPDDYRSGVGLLSMRERAEELGGTCAVEARAEGGTRVYAQLPVRMPAKEEADGTAADPDRG